MVPIFDFEIPIELIENVIDVNTKQLDDLKYFPAFKSNETINNNSIVINIGSIDEKRGLIGFEASDTNNILQISDLFKIDNLKKEYPKIAPEIISFVQELQKTKGMTRQAAKEFLIDLNSKSKNFEIAEIEIAEELPRSALRPKGGKKYSCLFTMTEIFILNLH